MNTEELYIFIKELTDISNYQAKIQILLDHKDDLLLQFVIEASSNFFKNYGYTKLNLPKKAGTMDLCNKDDFKFILQTLNDLYKNRILNTNRERFAESFLSKFNLNSQLILIKILCMDLNIDLTEDDIELIWPGLLPKFEVPGPMVFNDRYPRVIWDNEDNFYISQLHDGHLCYIIKDYDNTIKIYTKHRRRILCLKRLEDELLHILRNHYAVVIEGILKRTDKDGNIESFTQKRLGKNNVQITRPVFLVTDILPLHSFIYKSESPKFSERYALLEQIFNEMINYSLFEYKIIKDKDGYPDYKKIDLGKYEMKYTYLVKQRIARNNMEEIFTMWRDNNWKGLIIKKDVPFFVGFKSDTFKMQSLLLSNYEIIEVLKTRKTYYNKGKTKSSTIIKSLVIKHKDKFEFVNFGFSEDFKIKYGKDSSLLKGKIIQVAYPNDNYNGLVYPMFMKLVETKNEK